MVLSADDPRAAAGERPLGGSDEELIRGCARGEDGAFAHLLDRYRARVSQFVRWYLGGRSLWAEDVAQEVFVQVHRRAASFEGRSSFRTWLYGVALNVCRGHIRRDRVGRRTIDDGDGDVLAEIPDRAPGPLQSLEQAERDALVRRAIERLPPLHRAVLHLRGWEELSYEQIADVLSVPVGTVRSRLHNARVALAKELADVPEVK